jgi:phosphoglycolate phosphatase-like HAD superfamily hydrolase
VGRLLVLWDIDFTLVTSRGLGEQLYRQVFSDLFGREVAALAPMAGRTDWAIVLETLALAGIADPLAHVPAFLAAMDARAPALAGLARERVRPLPGAGGALAAVAALPGPPVQSVLTGNVPAMAALKVAVPGFTRYLDLAVGAFGNHHEIRAELVHDARAKAARFYRQDFGGAATVLIGDTPLDVAAALATGARAVGVASGGSTAASLREAGAHAVLPDLCDIASVVDAICDPVP